LEARVQVCSPGLPRESYRALSPLAHALFACATALHSSGDAKPVIPELQQAASGPQDGLPGDKEELQKRQSAALRRWLEDRLGAEKASLVRLLASHGAVCKGGAEEAQKLVDALLVWKASDVVAKEEATATAERA
jgi:hypothetical protein